MSETRERPILMSAELVRAILDGTKTQTRRPLKPQPAPGIVVYLPLPSGMWKPVWGTGHLDPALNACITCPYGAPGDRLWVRETWAEICRLAEPFCSCDPGDRTHHCVEYRADNPGAKRPGNWDDADTAEMDADWVPRWRPSIQMPRWASRLTLEITAVRPERLHAISEADAQAEGTLLTPASLARGEPFRFDFAALWDAIYGNRAPWDSNPWVWVVAFKRLEETR